MWAPCEETTRFLTIFNKISPIKNSTLFAALEFYLNITPEGCEKLYRVQAQGSLVPGKSQGLTSSPYWTRLLRYKVPEKVSTNVENLPINRASGDDFSSELLSICNFYGSDINMELLETQLSILKMNAQESSIAFVSSMIDFLNANGFIQWDCNSFGELILVMPATNVFEWKVFQCLKKNR